MDLRAEAADRHVLYRRIATRNRVVSVLRLAVPALGILVLATLVVQIYISSFGNRFGVGSISVTRDLITVDAPEYAGLLDDGSTYRVWAEAASAKVGDTSLIDLSAAALTLNRTTGTTMQASAPDAVLDTTRRVVVVDDVAYVEDSTGTRGTLYRSEFDWAGQQLQSSGPVAIEYADGATVDAEGLFYDARQQVWTFTRATVTLPSTPGEEDNQ
jgi:lipopolysaccharide export system protein LptC